jgi:hypothetical protein
VNAALRKARLRRFLNFAIAGGGLRKNEAR